MKPMRSMLCLLALLAGPALAQTSSGLAISHDKPVEITSDTLEVFQPQKKAIFTGNVVAVQGDINMKAARMVVFYRDEASAGGAGGDAAAAAASTGQGIYRIEADGEVFFATPQETAQGDNAIYDVDADTIDLLGNVLLTREKNVLKGTRLNYNLATGRSVLTGGAAAQGGGRVRGLFLPNQAKKPAGGN